MGFPERRLKICHLMSGDLWAGAEAQLFHLLEALRARPDLDILVVLLNEGELARRIRGLGIPLRIVEESSAGFLSLLAGLRRVIGPFRPDVLHSHRYKENILAALLKKPCRIRHLVQTIHGLPEAHASARKKTRDGITSTLNRLASRTMFDRLIPVSFDIRDHLLPLFPGEKMSVVHNVVSLERIEPGRTPSEVREEFGFRPSDLLIGSAGRMVPVKGYEIFLESVREVAARHPEVRVILAGDGPLLADLESLSSRLGLEGVVRFPGFREDIHDLLNALDLFVLSSHHEGVPMVLLEAMALGKAVVAPDVGGLGEVVEAGTTGLLVPRADPAALGGAIGELLRDPVRREEMGAAGARRIREHFSARSGAEQMYSLYLRLSAAGQTGLPNGAPRGVPE